jgi:hypothetical protein
MATSVFHNNVIDMLQEKATLIASQGYAKFKESGRCAAVFASCYGLDQYEFIDLEGLNQAKTNAQGNPVEFWTALSTALLSYNPETQVVVISDDKSDLRFKVWTTPTPPPAALSFSKYLNAQLTAT